MPTVTTTPVKERRQVLLADYRAEGTKRFGEDRKKWLYVCPICKTVQGYGDFKRLPEEMSDDKIASYLAFSCIGRFTEGKKGCDWTLGGLFQIHTLEVIDDEGRKHPRFEFAEIP